MIRTTGAFGTRVPHADTRYVPQSSAADAFSLQSYKVENEPPLIFSRLYAMDGNNSLKRIAKIGDREVGDTREFKGSDYYLSDSFVSLYANEVKPRKAPEDPDAPDAIEDLDGELVAVREIAEDEPPTEGDPTDGVEATDFIRICVRNWKSAKSEEAKKTWSIFAEAGIFAAACRHGFILWVIDMVRSGEL